ncbi:MAG: transaldolase [Anaerolineaceae bacterium]|nr:transaldolase [Anaerolineaceae bacterium]
MNAVKELSNFGQSIWFDYIQRNMLDSGELTRLIDVDGVSGVTSNPSIFQAAITGGDEYLVDIQKSAAEGKSVMEAYESLAIADIQKACDIMRPVFDAAAGNDGYVSMEVSPYLANETEATIEEARRLYKTINRKNVMIKVPATAAGIPAVETLISEGININVTLLFSVEMYRQVMEAYLAGLEKRSQYGDLSHGSVSVASFFVSRVDTLADELLEKTIAVETNAERKQAMQACLGSAAVANARLAYRAYEEVFSSERFKKLAAYGARKQRVLWASTGTKNPAYSDVKYIQELIAPESVNTVPPTALEAFRDQGIVKNALAIPADDAQILANLKACGVDIAQVTEQLLDEGVTKFSQAFDKLLNAVEEKMKAA